MGKRKRSETSAIHHSSASDSLPCSSGRDLTSGENSSDPDNPNILKSHPSLKEIMDSRGKQPNSQLSLGQHHHQNLSRSMFLKRSRHHYGNQYSRRNSSNYNKPSSSYGRGGGPFHDERLCFKMGSKNSSDLANHSESQEFREKGFMHPERIRSSSLVIHAISPLEVRMPCMLCQQPLKPKALNLGSTTLASEEPSVVAVLVCGHIFHDDCLERRTCLEDKRDPPCPLCSGFIPEIE